MKDNANKKGQTIDFVFVIVYNYINDTRKLISTFLWRNSFV